MHGFEYERVQLQGERVRDDLSLHVHFWLVAVDLHGERSFQELCLGIFSFGRPVACLRRQPDRHVSPHSERGFGRTGGWSERELPRSSRSTDMVIASLLTFSIRFPRLAVSGQHKSVSLLALEVH